MFEAQASQVILPGAGTKIDTSTTSASADLSAFINLHILVQVSADTYVRADKTAPTAVATDIKLIAGLLYRFHVTPERCFIAGLLASGTGTLVYAVSSR
jgi:hypothetical protein